MSETDLSALRDKYERMLRLRLLHAQASKDPGFVEPAPQAAMAALARDFPGSLRELDELPIETIRERIQAVAAAENDPARAEPWMPAQLSFHRLARGALAVKRWIRGRPITSEVADDFSRALHTLADAELAAAWADDLTAIATPPRGRVMDLVYERLARELGTDEASARAIINPTRGSRRRA